MKGSRVFSGFIGYQNRVEILSFGFCTLSLSNASLTGFVDRGGGGGKGVDEGVSAIAYGKKLYSSLISIAQRTETRACRTKNFVNECTTSLFGGYRRVAVGSVRCCAI